MSRFKRAVLVLWVLVACIACSRKKNTFLNRNWHAVTTEYNTLYNGNLALTSGQSQLNSGYRDNYWDLLPIEPLQLDDRIILPDSARNVDFGIAEEKAVKAIQRHSMMIGGKEKNPQIDEAYMLLGKARYFDQRFIPALEAFNFILQRYPESNNVTNAQIWRAKANIRLENNQVALENLKQIISNNYLEDQELANANAAIAQVYINLKYPDSALAPLTVAANFTKKNDEKGRYYFILGQLYNSLSQSDNANIVFDEVIDLQRKTPRIYRINAYVEKARNFDYKEKDPLQLKEMLFDLADDRENRPFLDKIYFQIAEYFKKRDSLKVAISYYNESLKTPISSDRYLRSINYEILGNIQLDKANYQAAASYFDSTLAEMSTDLREYRTISKKRKKLDEVIRYQKIATRNDSILNLLAMPKNKQQEYFQQYIDTLKQQYLADLENKENKKIIALNNRGPGVPNLVTPEESSNAFYFYNANRIFRGEREFIKTWGNRELTDNWRWKAYNSMAYTEQTEDDLAEFDFENDPRFNTETYISQLPTEKSVIDSIQDKRNYAYYELGLLYKEQFGKYDWAVEHLESLLKSNQERRLVLPAKFNLYQLYEILKKPEKREQYKQDILKNYPDSQFASYIRNPKSIANQKSLPEQEYKETYKKYENQLYKQVLTDCNTLIPRFTGNPIVTKFKLLKATTIGRLEGLVAYRKALNEIAVTYPQSEEGIKAANLIGQVLPKLFRLNLETDSISGPYNLVYQFKYSEREEANKLKATIDSAIVKLKYQPIACSVDVYSEKSIFVRVYHLKNEQRALGFGELLRKNDDYEIENEYFTISNHNYRVIQIKKNLDTYLKPVPEK
ncbi:tetratricopeptide repeat protein [Zunongwangia sp.]|uniref:type IX secretion system periplasmic lipoprotein PorW/SprE n=1 Tax=Zunongwangia sp. TaxID=1965325 RepID=UPI003AA9A503